MKITNHRLKQIIKEELARFSNIREGIVDAANEYARVGGLIAKNVSESVKGVNMYDPRFDNLGQAVVIYATAKDIAIEKMVSKVSEDLIKILNKAPITDPSGSGRDLKQLLVFAKRLEQKAKQPSSNTKKDPEASAAAGQRSHTDRLRAMIAKQREKLKDPTKTGGGMRAELERSIKELEAKLAQAEAGAVP